MNMQHSLLRHAALAAQHPAIAALLSAGPPPADVIDAFLAFHDLPITEPGAATFAFRGEATRVELVRAGADSARTDLFRVPGSDLWILRLPVEQDDRFEYTLAVHRDGRAELIVDPANPHRIGDATGERSVCRSHGNHRHVRAETDGAPAGLIETVAVSSETFGATREEQVYLPPGYAPEGIYPLVVIHDGAAFAAPADVAAALDSLIASGDIPPVVVTCVQTRDRSGAYHGARRHGRYLVTELLPVLAARYALSLLPHDRVLVGTGLGAVASISTAVRYPGAFGGLVLKAGAFVLDQGKLTTSPRPVFHGTARLTRGLQRAGTLPATRAFVSAGDLAGPAPESRALASFLLERGADVRLASPSAGDNRQNWRDQLRDGLKWVLRPERDAG